MPYKNPPPCSVCGHPSHAKKLCAKHYERFRKTGDCESTLRPPDWGKRNVHPLWENWKNLARSPNGREPIWDDFWKFVDDVGDKPEKHRLYRYRPKEAWGPSNFFWKPTIQNEKARKDHADYQRKYRAKNRLKSKSYDLKKLFGITLEDYHNILEKQNGVCAICLKEETMREYLSVDHCHTTGMIRGLLCGLCNRALGGFKDNIDNLSRAIDYLKNPTAQD